VNSSFAPIGQNQTSHAGEGSFWPSFTDIMMVITMIFLMATSLLVVRNWQLVAELRESVEAEQVASQRIMSTSLENSTLEERLVNAEQSNSILRLRLLKKDEALQISNNSLRQQKFYIEAIEADNERLKASLGASLTALAQANTEIGSVKTLQQTLDIQVLTLTQELQSAKFEQKKLTTQLAKAQSDLVASKQSQQQNIADLMRQKQLLSQEVEAYNQQLLALKGDYETVKTKYEDLIKPARSAKGKYIVEVYYIRGAGGEVIRYKQPGNADFIDLSLAQVEKRLTKLKREKGNDLYVKIIIPTDSGLTYNEAWEFMRNLLAKYDYYYQEN
jgi:septal ring factor EnvC (AmiA/AmiB activator)